MPHTKFLVAGGLIIGAISYLMFSGISDSMVYYYSVSEVLAKAPELGSRGIRVSGFVSPGTIRHLSSQHSIEFVVFEKNSDLTIPVVYRGVVPDTFKDHAEVVVEGHYDTHEGVFRASTLLAKCPSKYETLDEDPGEETGFPAPAEALDHQTNEK